MRWNTAVDGSLENVNAHNNIYDDDEDSRCYLWTWTSLGQVQFDSRENVSRRILKCFKVEIISVSLSLSIIYITWLVSSGIPTPFCILLLCAMDRSIYSFSAFIIHRHGHGHTDWLTDWKLKSFAAFSASACCLN